MRDFEKFKEELPSKEKFYSSLTNRKIDDKEYEHVLNFLNYGLCPSHYLSTPGLSWDVMLKMTKIKLVLIPDPDMYIFFQKGTRGEISYISNI